MRVLFSALHFANFRNYESVIRELAGRGHHVHLCAEETETLGGHVLVERLTAEYAGVSWGWAPSPAAAAWFPFAQKVRYALDYVRFLGNEYADAEKLRLRNVERTPRVVRWLAGVVGSMRVGQRALLRTLAWIERRLPPSEEVKAFLVEQRPDVLLLTSLTMGRSAQIQQLKAAKALGVRTAACVLSWDHLSSKALLHLPPDRTLVWNETQKNEAIELHGLPAAAIVVTGAQCYDQWFDRSPLRSREEFCAAVGLDPARRMVLYVCSAMSPVPDPVEPVFVREWIRAMRASQDRSLREAAILVRPHPERIREWRGISLDDEDNVVVSGRAPIDGDAKADYFDALYYSDAVVGLCTSAFLEAAIIGRPVLTLLLPAFRMHQEGMAHFRYLLTVGGGLLHTAPNVEQHLQQLADALRSRGVRDTRNQRFLAEFIRPRGLSAPATPVFVDAVDSLAREGARAPDARFAEASAASSALSWLADRTRTGLGAWLMMDALDDERARSERSREALKGEIVAARESHKVAKLDRAEQLVRDKERERRAKGWARWRRGLNARKQFARLKGSLKERLGADAHE